MDILNSGELRLAAAAGLLGGGWHLDGAAPHWAEGDLDPAAAVSLAGRGREYVAPVFTLRRIWRLGTASSGQCCQPVVRVGGHHQMRCYPRYLQHQPPVTTSRAAERVIVTT